ncbi:MAG: T9SS type A sorting domain-containing protein [Lewinellaceae bacterium]|nr:T9SS type A sorting domain-containing protein [Lewinellaceae bacterium]
MTDLNNPATILLNKIGCESREAIEVNCTAMGTDMAGGERNSIDLFPNPTSGIMSISGLDPLEHATARITDTMGKLVADVLLSANTIDLSRNPNGWGFVTITTNNQQVTKRVFKSCSSNPAFNTPNSFPTFMPCQVFYT